MYTHHSYQPRKQLKCPSRIFMKTVQEYWFHGFPRYVGTEFLSVVVTLQLWMEYMCVVLRWFKGIIYTYVHCLCVGLVNCMCVKMCFPFIYMQYLCLIVLLHLYASKYSRFVYFLYPSIEGHTDPTHYRRLRFENELCFSYLFMPCMDTDSYTLNHVKIKRIKGETYMLMNISTYAFMLTYHHPKTYTLTVW